MASSHSHKHTPREYEALKTKEERAEDIAYTINHALACTFTDWIDPVVGNFTQRYLGKRFSVGCGHDHSGDHGHGHSCSHHDHDHDHSHDGENKSSISKWVIGELTGDFGAVPITIAFQRFTPGLMSAMRSVMEPFAGPAFKLGANLSAQSWARKNEIDPTSDVVKEKASDIYEHEMRHLPQAFVWTASSVAINIAMQRKLGNDGPLWHMLAGKLNGVAISTGAVVGGRAIMPQTARKWDQWTSDNIFLPMTKLVGKVAGIKDEDVERMAIKEGLKEDASWVNKIKSDQSQSVSAERSA